MPHLPPLPPAFTKGWDMTLVLLALLPVLGASGYALSVLIVRLGKQMNAAYAGERLPRQRDVAASAAPACLSLRYTAAQAPTR
jgi:hypothetical protein